ncbi:MAG TPA: endonuclease/exonuclease/phosphatase family protein [Sphaerochaeta sp.]|nr:endonuclease/exonuclease/phosphatase family protein [Sphaerochaeta sp.]
MWTVVIILCLLFGSCTAEVVDDPKSFRVLSYNVQNLFDARLDGDEYPEYQDPKRYSERSYRMRLDSLGRLLLCSELSYPDVIVLQEVEGPAVIHDLLAARLGRAGYRWYATAKEEGGAISVAIISRHPLSDAAVHEHAGGRPVLEAQIDTERGIITIFALHAKSQVGDITETEAMRLSMMQCVAAAAKEVAHTDVLICGDFNENPTVIWENIGVQPALVDLSHPDAASYVDAGSLAITGAKDTLLPTVFYNPYLDEQNQLKGSYCYQGRWQQYDQVQLGYRLFDQMGWEYEDFIICDLPRLLDSEGKPKAWSLQLLDGYSDHLPVLVTLRRR